MFLFRITCHFKFEFHIGLLLLDTVRRSGAFSRPMLYFKRQEPSRDRKCNQW